MGTYYISLNDQEEPFTDVRVRKALSLAIDRDYVANTIMQGRYDTQNPPAIKRLVANGTQLRPYPMEVMEASLKATNELWGEISAKNPDFKKAIEAMQAFRNEGYLWWQVAEYTFDGFQIRTRPRG